MPLLLAYLFLLSLPLHLCEPSFYDKLPLPVMGIACKRLCVMTTLCVTNALHYILDARVELPTLIDSFLVVHDSP